MESSTNIEDYGILSNSLYMSYKKKPLRIGVDIDDVLLNLISEFLIHYNQQYSSELTLDEIHSYSLGKVIGISFEKAVGLFYEFYETDSFKYGLYPVNGAVEGIARLKQNGIILEAITARPEILREITHKQLDKYFSNSFEKIHIMDLSSKENLGRGKGKHEICLERGIEVMIDDRPETVKDCAKAGIQGILYEQPWNRNTPNQFNVTKASSWKDIVDFLIEYKNKMYNEK